MHLVKKIENGGEREIETLSQKRSTPMYYWFWLMSKISILLARAGGFTDMCRLNVCMSFLTSDSQNQWPLNS